ncbi:MAG: NUDIX domain-containing protein [Drouetiella hepatica Uher 2000/2452]|jgi:8-oxo-dGTP pyrophosphatase MutT (NUDIX family)|uniref:NUDIX domain-containing protein n=1 Tax=Drouetiella hepatica Uher 2000/2452 TaxID=904376 RepID=A0A951QGV6_9CYAN|nr:NUDIX domain-containing protein [Drouetiella hepatica Uher 2000/2452]
MDKDRIIFSTQWIAVKESPRGFQYLERKGKDSVSVFLLRRSSEKPEAYEVLIRQQHLCIDNREVDGKFKLFPCPVTGAMEEGESPEAAAQREVYEETGYRVQVSPLGQYIVGTQVNEICYLYYADVTGVEPGVAQQDGTYMESIARNEWHPFENLESYDYSACQIGYLKLQKMLSKG